MNYLKSALFLVSACFLFINIQAAAYDKPTVSNYVKKIEFYAPSTTTKNLLKSSLNNLYVSQVQYHTNVEDIQTRRKRMARTSARIALLATRVHIPIEELPSVVRDRELCHKHADDIALICNDARLPFETLEEYCDIVERIISAGNILKEFSDGTYDNLVEYEESFAQFIDFLIEVCPDDWRDHKQKLQARIVYHEPETIQQFAYEDDLSLAASSDLASLFDGSLELYSSSDDESAEAEAIRKEAEKSYQATIERMLKEHDDALRMRKLLKEYESVAS